MIYKVLRTIFAVTCILFLHLFISFLAATLYSTSKWAALVVLLINIPAFKLSASIYRLVHKMGIVDFITMNSATSELDVPKEDRMERDDYDKSKYKNEE